MSLFQNTIVAKYLQTQSKERISNQWSIFQAHFHNPAIQENIRNSKEEQYQGGFIMDLFVNILGYTKNPTPDFNITTEYKNVKDSKKADGAIIFNKTVKAVIELKGTNTTDLNKIETQAFGYKNNQPSCSYIVTSNFEKLRFYIDNAIEHIEFNLFTLTQQQFELLYLCLAKENIENDIPKKLKEQSVSQEDAITKNLYKDYSLFKRELHQNLVQLNPDYDALTLFKKSQKLLDRFLFLFFAEDRQLLPPNSVRLVLKQWKQLKDLDEDIPLYNRFKKYFGYLNTGFKGKQYNVYAYNGGLFKADTILDTIVMDDDLLYKHSLKLSEYDFASEVDVNILGHIFENSLTEMEGVQAELEGQKIDKTKTKRKKDGVFYTPKYITKYIVENTVGKLCEEKKLELQIDEDDYITDKKRQKKTIKAFADKLSNYRNWLLQLTICDPACGSGAFLNQALDFLIKEHSYIDELQAKLFGDAMVLSDVEKSILENNLFGVDLNEESVEIAKLSLWLRTAQPNRKLNDLSNNIKCGNSLIDDPDIAGNKAFNWQKEFSQIFKEINQKIYHVTTAIHDSRTSNRMIEYKVRERRDMGTNPYPKIIYFTKDDDLLITQTIADIAKEDDLKILAYNICADHIHLLLVCDIDEIPNIMQKIKGRSSFVHNNKGHNEGIDKGLKPLVEEKKQKNKPLWQQKYSVPKEVTNQEQLHNTINYIQNNRHKHGLPAHSKTIENIIDTMCCDIDTALKPKYIGGFDVVIGNPPYVSKTFADKEKDYYNENFETAQYQLDLYISFMEKGLKLLKSYGEISYIVPNSWLKNLMFDKCRLFMLENLVFQKILPNLDNIFADAQVDTMIFVGIKSQTVNDKIEIGKFFNNSYSIKHLVLQKNFYKNEKLIFDVEVSDLMRSVFDKIYLQSKKLEEVSEITRGINPYDKYRGQSEETIKNKLYHSDFKKDKTFLPELRGKHINRYNYFWDNKSYVSYGNWLAAPRDPKYFEGERILCRQVLGKNLNCAYINENFIIDQSIFIAKFNDNQNIISPKFVLLQLTSKLISTYFKYKSNEFDALFPKIKIGEFKSLPIKIISKDLEEKYILKSKFMITSITDLNESIRKFQRTLQRKFEGLEKLPKKLQNWYLLPFTEFIKELNKKKIKLALSEEAEWEDYFLQEKQKAQDLKSKIEQTDAAIDQMVYQLYGLTDKEIAIVEAS